jgi:hypothetical protein
MRWDEVTYVLRLSVLATRGRVFFQQRRACLRNININARDEAKIGRTARSNAFDLS